MTVKVAADPNDIGWLTASDLAARTATGELSAIDIAQTMVARIEQINPALNAIIDFSPEQILRDAAGIDNRLRCGKRAGPLQGVPFTVKELTGVRGRQQTAGMLPLKEEIATADDPIVTRLRDAGALFLGKTNTPEAGYYGGTDNHLFGPTHNPWRRGYSPGGSSGGAAAAVAAGLGPLAEGSDGAGSVRIPAALCGVVGFKPSTGRIPQSTGRFYEWAYHGLITRTVADTALMFDIACGFDSCDPLSLPDTAESYREAIADDIEGLRVAWSPDLGLGYVEPEVVEICRSAVSVFEELGAEISEATPKWGNPQEAMWHGIWVPAYASQYDNFDWRLLRGRVDDNLIELIYEGERVTAVDIGRADNFRAEMWKAYAAFMGDYDIVVSPTVASAAFPLTQFAPAWLREEPLRAQILGWLLTYPFNMLTTPAISVPAGFTSDGLPVGLQLAGGLLADSTVLRAAANFEAARPWASRKPPLNFADVTDT